MKKQTQNSAKITVGSGYRPITQLATNDGARLVNTAGEFNAGSKAELAQNMMEMFSAIASATDGQLVTEAKVEQDSTYRINEISGEDQKVMANLLMSNPNDKTELIALGETIVNEIKLTGDREGFSRRFLGKPELQNDQVTVIIDQKNVIAATATGPTTVELQILQDIVHRPQPFCIDAKPFITKQTIQQQGTGILDRIFANALEAFMVEEDKIYLELAKLTIGTPNNYHLNVGITPATIADMKGELDSHRLAAGTWLTSAEVQSKILANPDFIALWNATSMAEEALQSGKIGNIWGIDIITDATRHKQHQVMDSGDMYMISTPESHGVFHDFDGIESLPIDGTNTNMFGRGWMMNQQTVIEISNTRSLVAGKLVF